ncbi:hypothetical protein [Archangium lipolyticum]|uniref:hypothetical protein n=1 Tax=Archangium lipolyticum TaxID=2970465 RepID=UPI00214A631B|nr:hypothetical protein [Archangium lipolyticum]
MNVKTLAALVGTLSLGSLVTGCATTSSAAPTAEKGAQGSCGASKSQEAQPSGDTKATSTPEKGGNAGCGAAGCGAAGCGGASNPK